MNFKHLLKTTALTALLLIGAKVGWGQVNITPTRTDVTGFATWTDVDVAGTTYVQLLKATSSTVTPAMNFDLFSSETLDFTARTYGGANATENTVYVDISTDNGANWTNIGNRLPATSSLAPVTQFNLSAYSGTQVKLKFYVQGTSNTIGVGIDDINIKGVDAFAPTLSAVFPADNSTDVIINPDLTLTFSESVVKGTGNITIKKVSDNSTVSTIDVTTSKVSISGSVVTVILPNFLENGIEYYINIDNTCFKDPSTNAFAGISDNSSWTFTTTATLSPVITLTSPNGGEKYYAGDNVTFTWVSANMVGENVKIEAYVYNASTSTWGWTDVTTSTENDGSFDFTIPSDASYGTGYKARITGVTSTSTTDESNSTFTVIAVANNLATLVALPADAIVKYTGKATITYLQAANNQKYIQDATAAVLIHDPTTAPGYITDTYAIGDGITNVEGKITLYNALVELVPQATTGQKISDGSNPVITPIDRSTSTISTSDQCKLVRVTNWTFNNPAQWDATTSKYVVSKNYDVKGVANTSLVFRTGFTTADYIGTVVPSTPITTVAIAGVFNSQIQFTARSLADIVSAVNTVTSATYTVNSIDNTISAVPFGTLLADFKTAITKTDANSLFEVYQSDETTVATDLKTGYKLICTAPDGITKRIYTITVIPGVSPTLVADASSNDVDNNIDVTFTYDGAWYGEIGKVLVNNVELTATTDYEFTSTTKVGPNTLRLKPSGGNAELQKSGTWNVVIKADGYADATVAQTVNAGAIVAANSTISVSPAIAINTTSTVTLTAKDQYLNGISGYVFKYDVTVKNDNTTNNESYTIDGTATTASAADVALTATNASGVFTFNMVIPGFVDTNDGISVQVQLNNGTTNFGDALEYYAPVGAGLSASATLTEPTLNNATVALTLVNETFADETLDKANFSLNGAPVGLSIGSVSYNSTTTATVTLAFDGTDFDTNVTGLSVTIAGAELLLGGNIKSNDLSITAAVSATVTTDAAVTTNGSTTATWEGDITSNGGGIVTEKGICWATTTNPLTTDNKVVDSNVGLTITGQLTGLTPNTLYHVRAYAITSEGTVYGEDRTFTTLLSSAKAITATTIGSVDETNKKITNIPGKTTVAELKAALTVSANAIFEIYTAASGTTVATGTDFVSWKPALVIRVTAQDASTQEYGISYQVVETTVHDVQFTNDPSGDSPLNNQVARISGVVTGVRYNTSGGQVGFFLQNGVGAWNGIYVYSSTTVNITDKLIVTGTVQEYNKITEISPTISVTPDGGQQALPDPAEVTAAVASAEQYEHVFVLIKDATCVSGSNGSYELNDGTATITAYKQLYSAFTLTVNNRYHIQGIIDWFNSGSKWEIYPRSSGDINDVTGIGDNFSNDFTVYPNPFTNEIRFDGTENVKRVVITSITGQVVKNEAVDMSNRISTSELNKGMYFVTFINDKGAKATKKMIKQ